MIHCFSDSVYHIHSQKNICVDAMYVMSSVLLVRQVTRRGWLRVMAGCQVLTSIRSGRRVEELVLM